MARDQHHGKKWPLYLTQKDIDKNETDQQGAFLLGGTYERPSRFASVQFWLLREKVFGSFQKSIQEYRTDYIESRDIIYLQNGHVYSRGTLLKKNIKFQGETYTVRIETNSLSFHDLSKYLRRGDIICMSPNNFKTFLFAEIINCERPPYHEQSCWLEIMVDNLSFDSKLRLNSSYHILVTGTCHASHVQSLRKLKQLSLVSKDDFPLGKTLLNAEDCERLPPCCPDLEVERENSKRCLNEKATFISPLEMVGIQKFFLDRQQAAAFRVVLTNQVAVIEGYPGSGKTFFCTALVRYLLTETSTRLKSPILFLCNTEGCLDHQLECMLSYTDNITRIGGPSKGKKIEHCRLSNRRRNVDYTETNESDTSVEEGVYRTSQTSRDHYPNGATVADKKNFSKPRSHTTCTKKKLPFQKTRSLSEPLNNLEATSSTSNEDIELFNDDKDEVNYVELNCDHSETIQEITKLKGIAKKILLFPLKYAEIVKQIVPQKFQHKLEAIIKCSESAESPEEKAEEQKIRLKDAVAVWLCLTPKDRDSIRKKSEFLGDVVASYHKNRGSLSEITVDKHMNSEELIGIMSSREYNELLDKILSPDADTFPLIEEAALTCLSKPNPKKIPSRFCSSGTASLHSFSSENLWHLTVFQRYQEFSKWRQLALEKVNNQLKSLEKVVEEPVETRKKNIMISARHTMMSSVSVSLKSDIVGMTFRSAARHPQFLKKIAPELVIVEESDEVLEGEVVTCLPATVQHLILVGTTRYQPVCRVEDRGCLTTLPGRLKKCGAPNWTLKIQHRMKPSIAELLFSTNNENIEYDPNIMYLLDIESVSSQVFFIEHKESMNADDQCHVLSYNVHEAKFLLCLFNYLTKTCQPETSITLLVCSSEQLDMVNELSKENGLVTNASEINDCRGEETDIVLLSLTNKVKCDPMRIFYDLHTAITRARVGFFCIGNFDLYTKHCSILHNFMQSVRSKGLSGETLLLRCANHPEILNAVSSATDFKSVRCSECRKMYKK